MDRTVWLRKKNNNKRCELETVTCSPQYRNSPMETEGSFITSTAGHQVKRLDSVLIKGWNTHGYTSHL